MQDIKEALFENEEFIAMLSHDLKTPVKAQIRAINLLKTNFRNEFSDELFDLILNLDASNKYMQCLLDNVLCDFRINKNKFVLNKKENDIRKTIEEVLSNIGILFEVKNQKIEVNYLASNFIKSYDDIEIQRVLVNLLSNAFNYAKENSTIKLNINSELEKLKIEIISHTKVQDLFSCNLKNKANFGLGLIICEKIIKFHNGEFITKIKDGYFQAVFCIP